VSSEQPDRSLAEQLATPLAVEARTHRRTALVALRGELDLVTVSKVAEVLDGLQLHAEGVRRTGEAHPLQVVEQGVHRGRPWSRGAAYGVAFTLVMEPRLFSHFLASVVHPEFRLH